MDVRWIRGLTLLILLEVCRISASEIFKVHHRFASQKRSLTDIKAHDGRRHRRFLYSNIDLPLGGNINTYGTYFTELAIGSPPKLYHVLVDTGSDTFWVNCIDCTQCPSDNNLGLTLQKYDPEASVTAKKISCHEDFCLLAEGECTKTNSCSFTIDYLDNDGADGYYVKDIIQYGRESSNQQTTPFSGSVVFGCGVPRSAGQSNSDRIFLDGVLGFAQRDTTMLSQLASEGKVRRIFAHCLDGVSGGQFAIGNVLKPEVETTPLVPDQIHYLVNMEGIEVGGVALQVPEEIFVTGEHTGTVFDSGTTLAYLPEIIYEQMMKNILSGHSDLEIKVYDDNSCFAYSQSVDAGFPNVTFRFKNSLSLVVYPHDYLFNNPKGEWCIGWQNIKTADPSSNRTLFGDLVLSNKLVLYDLENQVMGWTNYNCSSSIRLEEESTRV